MTPPPSALPPSALPPSTPAAGIALWRAVGVQMPTEILWPAAHAGDAADLEARKSANMACALEMIDRAMADDPSTRLILLPEYAFTGQPNGGTVAEWIEAACEPVPGRFTTPLQEAARRHRIYLGGNQFEVDPEWPERFFNTSYLIAPDGSIILRYRRVHTAMWCSPHDIYDDYLSRYGGWESLWPVVDTELGRIGMIPCGEIAVPEVLRTMALRGTEVLLHPTWEVRSAPQDASKIAGAAANGMYIVSVNAAASMSAGAVDDRPSGAPVGSGSRIVDPRGNTVDLLDTHETGYVSAPIDVQAVRDLRADISMANPLLRLRMETVAPTYAGRRIYPPNAFLDLPLVRYPDIEGPAREALRSLHSVLDHAPRAVGLPIYSAEETRP
ncbi:amidohydrolase [Nakamurella sp. YIM 132087]|uniref:Amidohydrolase n=1 Tax=Nakamurella alba TaxID=2665158 RepID=A0A7K1FFU1_9ACTN|nr:nitrilase-related carbon-nitrogen hydrolase [Nakamurella alba]MTD12339.1 amidohydrolase [Nakamurella alba]